MNGPVTLLVVMDVEPAFEAEFLSWQDEEHVPERLAIPGFLSARRFRALDADCRFVSLYELAGPQVLQSEAYLRSVNTAPSERTLSMRPHFKVISRNLYSEIGV